MGFPSGSDSEESACNAGDSGSVPELGRSPGGGNSYHFSILAWRIPWTEEPGGLQSMGSQKLDMTEQVTLTRGLWWPVSQPTTHSDFSHTELEGSLWLRPSYLREIPCAAPFSTSESSPKLDSCSHNLQEYPGMVGSQCLQGQPSGSVGVEPVST